MGYCHLLGGCSSSLVFHPTTVSRFIGPALDAGRLRRVHRPRRAAAASAASGVRRDRFQPAPAVPRPRHAQRARAARRPVARCSRFAFVRRDRDVRRSRGSGRDLRERHGRQPHGDGHSRRLSERHRVAARELDRSGSAPGGRARTTRSSTSRRTAASSPATTPPAPSTSSWTSTATTSEIRAARSRLRRSRLVASRVDAARRPAGAGRTPPGTAAALSRRQLVERRRERRRPWIANSAAFIAWIGVAKGMHPDFGGDAGAPAIYGMPYVVVPGTQPLEPMAFDYASESDPGAPGRPAGYPIPVEAKTQTHWIEGGYPGNCDSSTAASPCRGDKHLLDRGRGPPPPLRDVEHALPARGLGRRARGARARAPSSPSTERAPAGGLDERRRGRPRDPARPRAVRRGHRSGADPPRVPRHAARLERVRVSRRRTSPARTRARRRWARACGSRRRRTSRVSPRRPRRSSRP